MSQQKIIFYPDLPSSAYLSDFFLLPLKDWLLKQSTLEHMVEENIFESAENNSIETIKGWFLGSQQVPLPRTGWTQAFDQGKGRIAGIKKIGG